MNTTQTLIALLKDIEADGEIAQTIPDSICNKHDGYYQSDLPKKVQEAIGLANEVLITPTGSCDWAAHKELKEAGYPVTCGERDSFGWLTGVIHTAKGEVIYG